MAGIKNQKIKKPNHENMRCFEYWQKENPQWTQEQCEEKAKWFRKSCNYQSIEYYERKYPELSHEEHLQKRKELQEQKKSNNPLNLAYYQKRYPELSKEEQEKMWHQYTRSTNYTCVEYYEAKGFSKKEAKKERDKYVAEVAKKISAKVSGEGNGMHRSKTSQEKRNGISPRNIAFYERLYPDLSHEEHLKLQRAFFDKNAKAIKDAVKPTNLEYYLQQGMSEEQAKESLAERQRTFSLKKCIERYGEVEGAKRFSERQQKWLASLYRTLESNGDGRSKQSFFAKDVISECCCKLNIDVPKKEKYIYDIELERAYAYDFTYKNKIIEFNGDYWHCNPKLYKEDFYNKVKKKTAKEIWEFDKAKIECAERYNYQVLVIWELDYNEDSDKVIDKCIQFLLDD